MLYARCSDIGSLGEIEEKLTLHNISVFGCVIDTIDRIMHGMELGNIGMHNQIEVWLKTGFLAKFLEVLISMSYRIWLTSDHGNVDAVGIGSIAEGVTADIRGQRVRIYSDRTLRDNVQNDHPEALSWEPVGLPNDVFPLLAKKRHAFVSKSKKTVTHGGASLEEVVVPLVQVQRSR